MRQKVEFKSSKIEPDRHCWSVRFGQVRWETRIIRMTCPNQPESPSFEARCDARPLLDTLEAATHSEFTVQTGLLGPAIDGPYRPIRWIGFVD